MRRAASDILCLASLLFASACTHEVDRFPAAYQGTQGQGSIGTGVPPNDDDSSSSGDGDASSSDDGGEADDGTPADGGSSPSTSATGAPADDDGGTDPSGVGDTGSGDPVLDACLDIAANECETCACNLCLEPLYACQQDAGCVAMRDCAEQTGCAGADCLEPCGAVIDMYGGPFGSSGALALELSDCLSASCPSCF